MKRPWTKWYWADWRSDPRLRMCGLAARGLWAEMLALMHEAEPYGHLLISGRPPTDTQLAILAGAPESHIPALLVELGSAGVFSKTRSGVIYSRRMTRDEKRRLDGEKSGPKPRGEGQIEGSRRNRQAPVTPREKPPPSPVVMGVASQPPSPQKLEARIRVDTREIINSLGAISRGKHLGPNYNDPAERKARWQQKMFEEVRRRLPTKNAEIIIEGYLSGEREALEFIESVDASVKARKAAV